MLTLNVTRTELARLVEWHPRTVDTAVRTEGLPRQADGTFDVAEVLRWMRARDRALRPPNARDRLFSAQEERVRLDLAVRQGTLVEVARVERAWSTVIVQARDGFLGLPSRLKTQHPDLPSAVLVTLDGLVRDVLEELATGPLPKAPTGSTHGTNGPTPRRRRAYPPGRRPRRASGGPVRRGRRSAPPESPEPA